MILTEDTVERIDSINPGRLVGIANMLKTEAASLWNERYTNYETDMQWDEWWNSYIVKLDYDELMSASEVISVLQNSLDREE